MTQKFFTLLVIVSLFLPSITACSRSSSDLPKLPPLPSGALVIENEGKVCFEIYENSTEIQASLLPKGCYSSSCTSIVQQVGNMSVDQDRYRLQFQSRFVVNRTALERRCTADCGGGGSITFRSGMVEKGMYTVWLGRTRVGELILPFTISSEQTQCFDTEHPATPIPTKGRVTPTPTYPYPYPPPALIYPTFTPRVYP